MSDQREPKIVGVDHLDNGAVVNFEDGRSGFYSAELLSEIYPRARDMQTEAQFRGLKSSD